MRILDCNIFKMPVAPLFFAEKQCLEMSLFNRQDKRKERRKANLPEQNLVENDVSQRGIPKGLVLMTVLPLSSPSYIPPFPADVVVLSNLTLHYKLSLLTLSTPSPPTYSEMDDL